MILQKIQYPSVATGDEEQLYFHRDGKKLIADTYFNTFSLCKWKKYSSVSKLQLVLNVKGSFKLTVFHQNRKGEECLKENLCERILDDKRNIIDISEKVFLLNDYKGNIGFELEPISEDAEFVSGWYEGASVEPIKPVRLAVNICTFRREEYVEKNICLLEQIINRNKNVEVFVIDNGQTLDMTKLNSDRVHTYSNKNVGGVGGFTRGIIEISDRKCFTHILLMDDDVLINPNAIEMMIAFLSLRRDEYEDMTVGGAMLLTSEPTMQFESGARWCNLCGTANHGYLDLKNPAKVLYNEEEDISIDYFAWWFCCMPISVVRADNLPLPIFVHMDDIEYGIRNNHNMVTMNGINVWHEDFDNKFPATMEYYDQRNSMIVAAIHRPEWTLRIHKKVLFREITRNMMKQRYNYAWMRLKGAEDFLKGIDWLKNQDGELLHNRIMQMNYQIRAVEEYGITREEADRQSQSRSWRNLEIKSVSKRKRSVIVAFRILKSCVKKAVFSLTFNGLMLPPKRQTVVLEPNPPIVKAFRAETIIHYNLQGGAYKTIRSRSTVIKLYKEYFRMIRLLNSKYQEVSEEYSARIMEIQNIGFWRWYLQR